MNCLFLTEHSQDVDPYTENGNGAQWFKNQNNFFRSIRNFVIDTTKMPASATGTGIHWQVAQATSLMNIHFEMSTAAGNAHQGIWMENVSEHDGLKSSCSSNTLVS
jgi:glucan 1,3-beta-glucosidase